MRTHDHPSEVTDAQRDWIQSHIPVYPGGRPRMADPRDVDYAVSYTLRTSSQWRNRPVDFLPVVRRTEGSKGWVRFPIRWAFERAFVWPGRCRRLSKEQEKSDLPSKALSKPAMIHLVLNRLEPPDTDAKS